MVDADASLGFLDNWLGALTLVSPGTPPGRLEPEPAPGPHPPTEGERYRLASNPQRTRLSEVGAGWDRLLERPIFWKAPLPHAPRSGAPPVSEEAFLRELRLAARLDHPHILRIYDVIRLPDGRYAAILPKVQGADLSQPGILDPLPLRRRLEIFQRLCLAAHRAHSEGILHRDIKPQNALYNAPGQIYLCDWGCALDLSAPPPDPLPIGTPLFCAPEQLRAAPPRVAADVFSLGALLYFMLIGEAPFPALEGETLPAYIARRQRLGASELSFSLQAEGPPEHLRDLCRQCLNPDPDARPATALALHDALQDHLDGLDLRARRVREAGALLRQAEGSAGEMAALRSEHRALWGGDAAARGPDGPGADAARWAREDARDALQAQERQRLLEALGSLDRALDLDPTLEAARSLWLSLHLEALETLTRAGQRREADLLLARARPRDDGRLERHLNAPGRVQVEGAAGSTLSYAPVVDAGRRLSPQMLEVAGALPRSLTLAPGRWHLLVTHPGGPAAPFPLRILPGQRIRLAAPLPPPGAIPEGMVYIPAGPALLGGDLEAFSGPPVWRDVPAFAIARLPVTCADWLAFLNALAEEDPSAALQRAPKGPGGDARWKPGPGGRFALPQEDAEGHAVHPRQPITLVSGEDARAYCRWRAAQDGQPYRLPLPEEWEKAARGADGRLFPWGDRFEGGFCNNREASRGAARLATVDDFPEDRSPYGVRGLGGGVSDLVQDAAGAIHQVRGGAWHIGERQCRAARIFPLSDPRPFPTVGLRLCLSLPPG